MSARIRLNALSSTDIMNEKRSHTLNTLGVPPSPQTGGQWVGGRPDKGGWKQGWKSGWRWSAGEKRGGKERKRPGTAGHRGQREREGSERPALGHSPLGWLGENATAHYMLCLCSVDEQCTITLPCCSCSPTAACLWGGRYCCCRGSPANSLSSNVPYTGFLMQIQVYVLETKALYECAGMKGGQEQAPAPAPQTAPRCNAAFVCLDTMTSAPCFLRFFFFSTVLQTETHKQTFVSSSIKFHLMLQLLLSQVWR